MKPWNKYNLIWLAVIGTAAICAFFTLVLIVNYFELGGKYWFAVLIALVPSVYGFYSFIKKYYPKMEDYKGDKQKKAK